MKISEAIKQIRQKAMLSQEDFARELDVSFATVNRWENGKTAPTYKKMRQIKEYCAKNSIPFEIKMEGNNG